MAVTIVLGDQPGWLRPVLSPLAELGSALHVLTAPDHHGALEAWSQRVLADFTPGMLAELQAFGFLWDHFRAEFMLPANPGTHTHLAGELDAIATLPIDEFAQVALRPLGEQPGLPSHVDTAATTDQLLVHARARSRRAEALTQSLLSNPGQVRSRLLAFLSACDHHFFATEWDRMAPSLRQAADTLRHIRDTRGAAAVLTGLAHGIRQPEPVTVVIDKAMDTTITLSDQRPLWVVPSLLSHPHLYVQFDPDWPVLVQYGAQRRVPGRPLPPLEVTSQQLQALADPSRLELCALIAREARAIGELATLSGLSAPTVSRHLKVLRAAGLVTSSQRGRFKLHVLDLDAIETIGPALVASLLR